MRLRIDWKTTVALAAGALVAMLASGCGNGENGNANTATPAPRTAAPTSMPSDELGISAVEAIINAAIANDTDALLEFVRYTPSTCATDIQAPGSPPGCLPSEPAGTLVDVVAIADCEGHYVREGQLRLDPLAEGAITFVNAFRAPEGFWPEGETVLLFTREQPGIPEIGWQAILTGGAITGIRYGCGQTASELIDLHDLTDVVPVDGEGDSSFAGE